MSGTRYIADGDFLWGDAECRLRMLGFWCALKGGWGGQADSRGGSRGKIGWSSAAEQLQNTRD